MINNIINSKWFTFILMGLYPLVSFIEHKTGNGIPRLALIPLIYIAVLITRNNYIWYFCFEFVILVLFALGLLIPFKYLDLQNLCIFSGVGLAALYMILVKIMDTRGYPVKRQAKQEEEK